jgi:hypothetical protein
MGEPAAEPRLSSVKKRGRLAPLLLLLVGFVRLTNRFFLGSRQLIAP